jgi:predicted Zn-dependent peptidase
LLIIEGRPTDGVSLTDAEEAIWAELDLLKGELIAEEELQKWKNQVESTLLFSETNVLNKAINLAFFEVLGNADLINTEKKLYQQVTPVDIHRIAKQILTPSNCSEVHYEAEKRA